MIESTMKPRDLVCIGRSGVDLYPCSYGTLETVREFTRHVGGSPPIPLYRRRSLAWTRHFSGKFLKMASACSFDKIWSEWVWMFRT